MSLKDILVISGQTGLFRYISKGRTTVIVEHLSDNKRTTVSATAKISMMEDIAVFSETGEVPLREIFKKIQEKENGCATISRKSADAELRKYFETILPNYDREKVYLSDIRKVLMWYNHLLELGFTDFEPQPEDEKKEDEKSDTEA